MKTFTYAAIAAVVWITVLFAASSTPVAVPVDHPAYTNTMGGVLGIYLRDDVLAKSVRGVLYEAPAYKFFEFPCPSTVQFEVRRAGASKIYWTEDWSDGGRCVLPLNVRDDEEFSIWTYSPTRVVPTYGATVRADTMPRSRE